MNGLVEKVARAAHDAQWEDGFDRLPPNGIERALAEQVSRAAIAAVAEWLDAYHKAEYLQSENHASPALRSALEAKP